MSNALNILIFSENFLLYFAISIFVVGTIGNVINICVLTTLKLFRSNQCAFYLIIESIIDTCQLFIIFIINLLPMILGFDPGDVSIVWCKLKNMLPQTLRLLSTSMVCFAALDQFLSTNPQLSIRQMSSLRLAYRLTLVAIVLWSIHSIPYGIFYQISSLNICTITNIDLIHYYSFFYYPILHGFLPILISSLLSLFAYQNVRRLIRRQISVVRRRLDRQLTAMIFVRVIIFVLFLLPYTIYRIYEFNITINLDNLYPYAINQLIYSITAALSDLNFTMNFYIFMATSSRYRRQVKHFFVKKCWRTLKNLCNVDQNEVHSSTGGISNDMGTDND